MAFKDVLVSLTTYPDPMPVSAVGHAVALAVALGARISAVACGVKVPVPGSVLAGVLLDVAAMAAAETRKSATNAQNLLDAFQAAAEKSGVFQQTILEQCLTSEVPKVLVEHARLRDLTIVPVQKGNSVDQWYAESIIFGSGRPTIIFPCAREHAAAVALDTVVVAWDFSRPATRAVADSLPILEKAKCTRIVTVSDEKAIDTTRSGAELAAYLARRGVSVIVDVVEAAGRSIGDTLESYVTSCNADLLVMGGYGHSRLRDFILGGATKSMLARPPLPVLLSH